MKIVAIVSYKGGTGKTLTAINLAHNLAVCQKKRVLAIDCDPQGNLSYVLGRKMEMKKGVYDVLTGADISSCIHRSIYENLSVMPTNTSLEELKLEQAEAFSSLKLLEGSIDYVVMDCHPSMQPVTIAALCAADYVIVPIRADRFSLNGMEMMQDYIEQIQAYNPGITMMGCLFTMYAGRRSQQDLIREAVQKEKYPVFNTIISDSEAANTSIEQRKALLPHRRFAPITRDYLKFTEEFVMKETADGYY